MRVVALISGGKDSCYNMVQCVAAGHEIVALANLRPENKDELDSYMYQTVGHQGIELYAEAMGLPLFRWPTQGVALLQEQVYTPTPEDEVEDLFQLLKKIKLPFIPGGSLLLPNPGDKPCCGTKRLALPPSLTILLIRRMVQIGGRTGLTVHLFEIVCLFVGSDKDERLHYSILW